MKKNHKRMNFRHTGPAAIAVAALIALIAAPAMAGQPIYAVHSNAVTTGQTNVVPVVLVITDESAPAASDGKRHYSGHLDIKLAATGGTDSILLVGTVLNGNFTGTPVMLSTKNAYSPAEVQKIFSQLATYTASVGPQVASYTESVARPAVLLVRIGTEDSPAETPVPTAEQDVDQKKMRMAQLATAETGTEVANATTARAGS